MKFSDSKDSLFLYPDRLFRILGDEANSIASRSLGCYL